MLTTPLYTNTITGSLYAGQNLANAVVLDAANPRWVQIVIELGKVAGMAGSGTLTTQLSINGELWDDLSDSTAISTTKMMRQSARWWCRPVLRLRCTLRVRFPPTPT